MMDPPRSEREEKQKGEKGHLRVRQVSRQSRLEAWEAALDVCWGTGWFLLSRGVNVRGGIRYRRFLGKRNLDALHENPFINT